MILADSSIWIDHFRGSNPKMRQLLESEDEEIVTHPFVVAELALGSLKDRRKTLAELDLLTHVDVADTFEVRRMVDAHSLYSRGIGLVDAHLLASCLLTTGTRLWTRDTRLQAVARSLAVDANLP